MVRYVIGNGRNQCCDLRASGVRSVMAFPLQPTIATATSRAMKA